MANRNEIRLTEAEKDKLAAICAELRIMRDAACEAGRDSGTHEAGIWWAGKYAGISDAEAFLESFLDNGRTALRESC